jgi:hypothetical protein
VAYIQKDGEGSLFIVDPERKVPRGPDWTGSFTLDGQKYRLAGWIQKGKNGKADWLSLKVQPWREGGEQRDTGDRGGKSRFDEEDEIPF